MSVFITEFDASESTSWRVLETAEEWEPADYRPYWKMIPCRTLGKPATPREEVVMRMDTTKGWKWKDDKLTKYVQELVEPFVGTFFETITRVDLHLQIPGKPVPPQQRFFAGQDYGNGIYMGGDHKSDWVRFRRKCNADPTIHRYQHYLTARLDLGPTGMTYILDPETKEKHFYAGGNWFHFASDIAFLGAEAIEDWRGTVFIDGIHKINEVQEFYNQSPV